MARSTKSSSGRKARTSRAFKGVLKLGQALVSELDPEGSADTLSKWMAHHIAGLMDRAKGASEAERTSAERDCADAILQLWAHRREMPDGRRPFEAFERAIAVVNRLDPDQPHFFYHRPIFEAARDDHSSDEDPAKIWLGMAEGLDRGLRVLIEHCVRTAALESTRKELEWVKLALELGHSGIPEIMFIERVLPEHGDGDDKRDRLVEFWDGRIEKLGALIGIARALEEDFVAQRDAALGALDGTAKGAPD